MLSTHPSGSRSIQKQNKHQQQVPRDGMDAAFSLRDCLVPFADSPQGNDTYVRLQGRNLWQNARDNLESIYPFEILAQETFPYSRNEPSCLAAKIHTHTLYHAVFARVGQRVIQD
jgi:hypothetical protein